MKRNWNAFRHKFRHALVIEQRVSHIPVEDITPPGEILD